MPGACAAAQSALDPAADQAQAIHAIWQLMLWICGFMYLLVIAAVVLVLWRRRRMLAQPESPPPLSDSGLSKSLAVWLAMIVAGLVVLAAGSFLVDRKLIPSGDAALDIRITGRQWWWQIEYLDPDPTRTFTTANELHLPLGKTAHIELRSDDVIHSFWLPNLAGKRDMIPGRINTIELTPRRSGTYRGPCAEFCGIQHAKMTLYAVVENDEAFAAWRARQLQPAAEPAAELQREGAQTFTALECALCHTVRGTSASAREGPDLTHFASRGTLAAGTLPLNPGSLAAWLADPQRLKPGTKMPTVELEPAQLNALVAYLLSLH